MPNVPSALISIFFVVSEERGLSKQTKANAACLYSEIQNVFLNEKISTSKS